MEEKHFGADCVEKERNRGEEKNETRKQAAL